MSVLSLLILVFLAGLVCGYNLRSVTGPRT